MKQSSKTEEELFWITAKGQELLSRVQVEAADCGFDPPKTSLKVKGKKSFQSEPNVSEAIEIVIARNRAKNLGDWCSEGLFTGISLQQSSHPEVAAWHARRFSGFSHVLEIGTGSGFDTAALAKVAGKVTTIEINSNLAKMARWNLKLQGISNVEVLEGDAETFLNTDNTQAFDGIFCDPSRRLQDGERTKDPEKWSPNLSFLREIDPKELMGIKVSPAVDMDDPYWVKEWIGFEGECKEQLLWRSKSELKIGVAVVDKNFTINADDLPLEDADIYLPEVDKGGNYLLEPHAALSRSGLFPRFLRSIGARQVHPKVYLGTTSEPVNYPVITVYEVLDSLSYHSKSVSRRIQELGLGPKSIIKTQGIKDSPELIRKDLSFKEGGKEGVIFFVRLGKEIRTFICGRQKL